ncbi:MAG: ribose-phosphate diphosphokinase, partial [Candidatus Micrarchaeota archaeon]
MFDRKRSGKNGNGVTAAVRAKHSKQFNRYRSSFVLLVSSSHERLGQRLKNELARRRAEFEAPEIERSVFADGENYLRADCGERGERGFNGKTVYVLGSVHSQSSEQKNYLLEMLLLLSAAKANGASRVCALLPFYAYGRQERVNKPGEALSALAVRDALLAAGADEIVAVDVHAPHAIHGVRNLLPTWLFAERARELLGLKALLPGKVAVFAPDKGSYDRAVALAKLLKSRRGPARVAWAEKQRPEHDKSFIAAFHGDVEGFDVVTWDDIASTLGTLSHGVKHLKELGAKRVFVFATHGVLVGKAWRRLGESRLEKFIISDSIPLEHRALSLDD